jgi:soluble cytochrome b562
LDGDQLIQEAKEEKEKLSEEIKDDYVYEGFDILIG